MIKITAKDIKVFKEQELNEIINKFKDTDLKIGIGIYYFKDETDPNCEENYNRSQTYMKNKVKIFNSIIEKYPELKNKVILDNTTFNFAEDDIYNNLGDKLLEIFNSVNKLKNSCDKVAIIIQKPIHKTLETELIKYLKSFNINKNIDEYLIEDYLIVDDIDCITYNNLGEFIYSPNKSTIMPCTVNGIKDIVEYAETNNLLTKGDHVLVIGRSNIVGKPASVLLTDMDYTVTTIHSKTPKELLQKLISISKLVITAVGKDKLINKDMIENNPTVSFIDVGINVNKEGKLTGDVDNSIYDDPRFTGFYTPVPGGVGPLTVYNFMLNAFKIVMKDK